MKITTVQTLVLNMPMLIDGPTPMLGGRPRTSIDMLLVRVETDGGRWDIAGKVAGVPLYRLLGGSPRADLPAYASLLRYGAAEAVARYTQQALGRGYRLIKLHEIRVPEVKAARDVAGPGIPIMVDTNCPWTVAQAAEMARRLAPVDPHWPAEPAG